MCFRNAGDYVESSSSCHPRQENNSANCTFVEVAKRFVDETNFMQVVAKLLE